MPGIDFLFKITCNSLLQIVVSIHPRKKKLILAIIYTVEVTMIAKRQKIVSLDGI